MFYDEKKKGIIENFLYSCETLSNLELWCRALGSMSLATVDRGVLSHTSEAYLIITTPRDTGTISEVPTQLGFLELCLDKTTDY